MIAQPNAAAPAPKLDVRGITAYLIITFGLTWLIEIGLLATGHRFDQMSTFTFVGISVAMCCPAIGAFIVRRWITREGFGDAGLRFGRKRPYLLLWLGVPVLFGVIYGLSALLGFARFDSTVAGYIAQVQQLTGPTGPALPPPAVLVGSTLMATLTIGALITSLFTFGEEFGWTGYLLPKLLPLGKWRATLVYGVIWGLWHAPVIFGGYNFPGYPILGIFLMCLFTVSLGLWQTSLRLRFGSVLLTTWFHASINSQARGIWAILFVDVKPLLGGVVGLVGLAVLGLIGAWMLARTPEPALEA